MVNRSNKSKNIKIQRGFSHSPQSHSGHIGGDNSNAYTQHQSDSVGAVNGFARHSRNNFVAPNRNKKGKKIAVALLVVLLLFFGSAVGYAFWYTEELNSILAMDGEASEEVNNALTTSDINEPFYTLVLGSDSREGSGSSTKAAESGDNERSDVMILLRVDASSRQLTLVSVPRDTPITLPDGRVAKLNEAYNIGGAAYAIEKVSELTGVNISHYAEVRFSEFEELVDKIGGVEVDVPVELSYKDALTGEMITLEPGKQTLNGQEAQIFARVRKVYEGNQDAVRQNNIRILFAAILDKVLDKPLHEMPNAVLDLATCVGTDLRSNDLVSLALSYAGGSGKMTIYSCSGPSDGALNESADIWLCYENPEGWKKLMGIVDSGEDPQDVKVEDTAIVP